MANTISISVLGDVSNIRKNLASVDSQLGGFGKKMGKVGGLLKGAFAGIAIGAGVAKAVDFLKDATQAASDLQQSTGAVDAVFGKSAAGIKKSAEGAAQAFGLSKNSYQELASTLGAGLKNQGIKDFAGQTEKVIGLGADLAAQFGGSTKDAVAAIGSLMRGEADPIERYGVGIKQSAINAVLAANGQDKLTGAARTQAEAQARLSLLFKQTKDAQGAFARESDTLAGKQARNAAAWENLKAKLGTVLLPVLTQVQGVIADKVLPVVEKFINFISAKAPAAFAAIGAFITGLKGDGTAPAYFETVKNVLGTVFTILKDIGTAVAANWPTIKEAVTTALGAILSVAQSLKAFWDAWGPTISTVVASAFGTAVSIISGALQIIAGIVKTVTALLTGDWKGAWEGIKGIVSGVLTIIKALVSNVLNQALAIAKGILAKLGVSFKGTWSDLLNIVKQALVNILAGIVSKLTEVKNKITSVWNSVVTFLSGVWSKIKSSVATAFAAVLTAVSDKIKSVLERVKGLKASITGVFSNAGSWLLDAGRRIINGLISGIRSMISTVRSTLSTLTNLIPSWKGPRDKDAKLLTEAGQLIMGSLVKGFEKGQGNVRSSLQDVTRFIATSFEKTMSPTLSPSLSLQAAGATLSGFRGAGPVGGQTVIHVTVQAPVGASSADIGRELEGYLNAYARSGGRKRAL